MEWWMPYAVVAAALVASMIAPMPLPRSRRRMAAAADPPRVGRRASYRFDDLDDEDDEPDETPDGKPPARAEAHEPAPPPRRVFDEQPRAAPPPPPRAMAPPQPAPAPRVFAPPPPLPRPAPAEPRGSPVTDRPGRDAPSYFRDPTALGEWPQAAAVEEAVRAFLDRWGGTRAGTTFRKVEVVPASNERAFAFLLAVEPERRGRETTLLARVCVPGENADKPTRFWATKYFDHIGERFREDVAKTPQHSRGVIVVRDVPPGEDGRGAVALDYEVPLLGDPYDDIRAEDVAQYKNLLNIMRMFA
jgi:hypothetical protein